MSKNSYSHVFIPRIECKYYNKGRCHKGNLCNFKHSVVKSINEFDNNKFSSVNNEKENNKYKKNNNKITYYIYQKDKSNNSNNVYDGDQWKKILTEYKNNTFTKSDNSLNIKNNIVSPNVILNKKNHLCDIEKVLDDDKVIKHDKKNNNINFFNNDLSKKNLDRYSIDYEMNKQLIYQIVGSCSHTLSLNILDESKSLIIRIIYDLLGITQLKNITLHTQEINIDYCIILTIFNSFNDIKISILIEILDILKKKFYNKSFVEYMNYGILIFIKLYYNYLLNPNTPVKKEDN